MQHTWGMINAYKLYTGKPASSRRRLEDNIRTDPRRIAREGVNWIHLAQDNDQW